MLKINFSERAEKFLKKLPAKQKRQIARKILQLSEDPKQNDIKKLKNTDYLRADMGEYRIIFNVKNKVFQITLIGKRNDNEVYRKLLRLSQ